MAARHLSNVLLFVAVFLCACTSDAATENSMRDADTQAGSTTTQPPSTAPPSEQFQQAFGTSAFESPTTLVDGAVVFHMVFLDGSEFRLMLPESVAADVVGFVPRGAVGWDEFGTCCHASLEIGRGSIESLYGDRQPDAVYEGAVGGPVNFYHSVPDYFVFEIGGWVIQAVDEGRGPGEQFSEEQRARFASLFDGYVNEEGFLVLTPVDPMQVLSDDIQARGSSSEWDLGGTLIAADRELVGVIKEGVCGNAPLSVTSRGYSYHVDQRFGLTTLCSPDDSSMIWIRRSGPEWETRHNWTEPTESELAVIQWTSRSP